MNKTEDPTERYCSCSCHNAGGYFEYIRRDQAQ